MAVATVDYAGHELAGAILYNVDGSVLIGQKTSAASLSVVPASDIPDATYIGDVKFGEAIPAGTAVIGKARIVTALGDEATHDTADAVKVCNPDGTNVGGTGGIAYVEGATYTLASDSLTPMGLYNGTSIKVARMLAASGDGLGVLQVGAGYSSQVTVNAYAARDTDGHDSGAISCTDGIKNMKIHVNNTLDRACSVALCDQSERRLHSDVSVPAGSVGWVMPYGAVEENTLAVKPVLISPLHASVTGMLRIIFHATGGAPTTGSVTITTMWEH